MLIEKKFINSKAQAFLDELPVATSAYLEIIDAIESVVWPNGASEFTINNNEKNGNGVVPIKDNCYIKLEYTYDWFREKPLDVLENIKKKGGPIDVYKEVSNGEQIFKIGLEFETGNVSSAHRAMNKLCLGHQYGELDLGVILLPVVELSYFLTDRVSNYEELEPYFEMPEQYGVPFIFLGFNADSFSKTVPAIPKGKDGMSKRSIRKWVTTAKNNG